VDSQSCQLNLTQPELSVPIRVIFDGRKLGHGGIGVYIDNTVKGLLDIGGVDLSVIASPEQAKRASWRSEVAWCYDSSKPYSLSEYLLLPRRIDFSAYDLYHSPHYTLPLGIRIPAVVTIHDLIHIEHPEAFYYPAIAKPLIKSAVARASKIIAVSQDTRRGLLNLTGAALSKVVHIPNAIPSFLGGISSSAEERSLNSSSSPLPIVSEGRRYFVTVVSNCKPHKGVRDLLLAWGQFTELYQDKIGAGRCPLLLLVGYGAEALRAASRSKDLKLISLARKTKGVRIVGAVNDDLLQQLYRGAEALVVPSLAEGFCFPALEAQSVGTRVICRPVAALKELITANDICTSDNSVDSLTHSLLEGALKPKCHIDGLDSHLKRFSSKRISEQIRDVYNSVII
jgi:glycosyltransferase involved in cell wall biosynthesis